MILIAAVYLLTLVFQPEPPEDYNTIYGEDVIIYVTEWCGYCKKMEATFQAKGIPYRAFDIETSSTAAQEFKSLGGRGVPVTLVKGTVVHGYNPKKVLQLAQR